MRPVPASNGCSQPRSTVECEDIFSWRSSMASFWARENLRPIRHVLGHLCPIHRRYEAVRAVGYRSQGGEVRRGMSIPSGDQRTRCTLPPTAKDLGYASSAKSALMSFAAGHLLHCSRLSRPIVHTRHSRLPRMACPVALGIVPPATAARLSQAQTIQPSSAILYRPLCHRVAYCSRTGCSPVRSPGHARGIPCPSSLRPSEGPTNSSSWCWSSLYWVASVMVDMSCTKRRTVCFKRRLKFSGLRRGLRGTVTGEALASR
jgi:hypothetical protein